MVSALKNGRRGENRILERFYTSADFKNVFSLIQWESIPLRVLDLPDPFQNLGRVRIALTTFLRNAFTVRVLRYLDTYPLVSILF